MTYEILTIDKEQCNELAYKIFMEASGINKEGRKFKKMQDAAMKMRAFIDEKVQIRAAYKYCDDVKLSGRTAEINGYKFHSNAFEQISADAVTGAYVYVITAGDYALPDENIMDQLYADIWGTSFTDAARILMKTKLIEADDSLMKVGISDSFGPGFYGMDIDEIELISNLIPFEKLGVQLKNNCIMIPLKSCAGIYFTVNEKYQAINQWCQDCKGTYTSCKLCQLNGGL